MNIPNNAAALERLEMKVAGYLKNKRLTDFWRPAFLDIQRELATLRATLAQPDAITSQPSGLRESLLVLLEKASEDVDQAGGTTWVFDDEDMKKLRALATADAPGVAVDELASLRAAILRLDGVTRRDCLTAFNALTAALAPKPEGGQS